jgi:hypothetical protein
MLNFFRWDDTSYQIVFEGNSYYFSHKLCVAFREKGSPVVFAKDKWHGLSLNRSDFIDTISYSSEIIYMQEKEFECALKATYAKALLRGVRRIGLDTLFCTNKTKGEKNVTDFKSDAG